MFVLYVISTREARQEAVEEVGRDGKMHSEVEDSQDEELHADDIFILVRVVRQLNQLVDLKTTHHNKTMN